jgi:hypothetical protein
MSRAALDEALARRPHLLPLIAEARERLQQVIDQLEPYADDGKSDGADPDLRFQVHILRQAAQELGYMLNAERAPA